MSGAVLPPNQGLSLLAGLYPRSYSRTIASIGLSGSLMTETLARAERVAIVT